MSLREKYAGKVREIAGERPQYRLGGDGSDGTCDCVGLGIGALRRLGIDYDGLHGSNWAARYEAVDLWEIKSVADLRVGDNVLKAYEPNESKWNLPDRYSDDPDQRDYYHFGVIVSTNPLEIVHVTSPTAKTDTVLGKWRYAFLWRQLLGGSEEEGKDMAAICRAKVILDSGWLNLRAGPDAKSRDIGDIPNGAAVEVLVDGAWPFIRYGEKTGYVKGSYLERIPEEEAQKTGLVGITGEPGPMGEPGVRGVTRLVCTDGRTVELVGDWREAED